MTKTFAYLWSLIILLAVGHLAPEMLNKSLNLTALLGMGH